MRRLSAILACAAVVLGAGIQADAGAATPQQTLARALTAGIKATGQGSSASVVDLTTGQTLYSARADRPRLPASVEKIYTTSTALLTFGPQAILSTHVLADGQISNTGTFVGTLYIQGGGDPSFGSAAFDRAYYGPGTGATMQALVANLIENSGITAVKGKIKGDESFLDSLRGTAPYGYHASTEIEGSLSGLAYDRGFEGSGLQVHPAIYTAEQFASALKAAHIRILKGTRIGAGVAPSGADRLATAASPTMATLVKLTNTPSDNFFAEMLLKDIGARFGGAGSSAAGAAVVRSTLSTQFGIHPRLVDGSGLSRYDRTTTRQVVTVLQDMANDDDFFNSLAVAGETGTLEFEMNHTAAQGRCRGKTGTLHDVSNLVGYCRARDGHLLAFAFLMNSINPDYAHPIQNRMAIAIAKYTGRGTVTSGGGVAPTARTR